MENQYPSDKSIHSPILAGDSNLNGVRNKRDSLDSRLRGVAELRSLNSADGIRQTIEIVLGVIERKRWPDGCFYAETSQRWLSTVVA
ncbi:MAG: hypothetical protein JWP89_1355 [Schlesneria sp.]|nr:hypothetical protein [Schlesneria sp.]